MNIARINPRALNKVTQRVSSGGGQNFGVPSDWITASFGSGWPIQPVSAPKDTEFPRSIDYPISVNATLTPRTGWGLMPFASLLEAYENVTECKIPIGLLTRELITFIPRLVDDDDNEVTDHPYSWMTQSPDRRTPWVVWLQRFLKSSEIYAAPAVYLAREQGKINAMHYIDGSTLFAIVDEFGNTPVPESIEEYTKRMAQKQAKPAFGDLIKGTPTNIHEFVQILLRMKERGEEVPVSVPAYTQIIKGTPFSWWSADQIWYQPQSRRMNSPYGESYIEQAWSWIMLIVNIVSFELGHYRTGNMPEGFVTLPKDFYPTSDRVLFGEQIYNYRMFSNPATERNRVRMFPDGTKYMPTKKADFPTDLYTQGWKNILHTIGIPPSEFGDIPGSGLGGKGFKEGAASDLSRMTLNPRRQFIVTPFNDALKADGVDDVHFDLGYPVEEIDADKLKQSVYDGLGHGLYTLNDALSQLGYDPVEGSMDKNGNPILAHIANKHLIVAGSSIYVYEDLQVNETGMAVPTASPKQQTGGAPVTPETAIEQVTPHTTPAEETKTLMTAIQNIMQNGKPSSTFTSLPNYGRESVAGSAVEATQWNKGIAEEREEHPELSDTLIQQLVRDHLEDDPNYYESISKGKLNKISMSLDLLKHCGVCPEDDMYFGAPISREFQFTFPKDHHANDVEIVAMTPPGLAPKPALWKPEGGEDSWLQEEVGGKLYPRAEAYYLMDRSLGFNLVPVSYVTEANGEKGSAIYYTFGNTDPLDHYATEWIERAAVEDYIASQLDRHLKHNYLTHPDDPQRLILIDNDLSFPVNESAYCNSIFCQTMINQALSEETLAAIQTLYNDAATWADIRMLVGDAATNKARVCAKRLLDERMITAYQPTVATATTEE